MSCSSYVEIIKTIVDLPLDTVWYDPFCGYSVFEDVLNSYGFMNVISQDLYTHESKLDYKDARVTRHDILITNPPFNNKGPLILKMFDEGKKFAIIVPFETVLLASLRHILKERGALIYVPREQFEFINDGNIVRPVKCCYFLGNFPNPGNKTVVTHL